MRRSLAGKPTAAGCIYCNGPPDEIESHSQQARESWLFHKLEGVGVNMIVEFTDPAGTGDFRMTRDPAAAK